MSSAEKLEHLPSEKLIFNYHIGFGNFLPFYMGASTKRACFSF